MPVTNMHRTKTISVHKLRRMARVKSRRIQEDIDWIRHKSDWRGRAIWLEGRGLPGWANGVRVEKAGHFQWTVVATEDRGH